MRQKFLGKEEWIETDLEEEYSEEPIDSEEEDEEV